MFSKDTPKQIWQKLRDWSDVRITPYTYQPTVLADAWNHNYPISPNRYDGCGWIVLRSAVTAKQKRENYEAQQPSTHVQKGLPGYRKRVCYRESREGRGYAIDRKLREYRERKKQKVI